MIIIMSTIMLTIIIIIIIIIIIKVIMDLESGKTRYINEKSSHETAMHTVVW